MLAGDAPTPRGLVAFSPLAEKAPGGRGCRASRPSARLPGWTNKGRGSRALARGVGVGFLLPVGPPRPQGLRVARGRSGLGVTLWDHRLSGERLRQLGLCGAWPGAPERRRRRRRRPRRRQGRPSSGAGAGLKGPGFAGLPFFFFFSFFLISSPASFPSSAFSSLHPGPLLMLGGKPGPRLPLPPLCGDPAHPVPSAPRARGAAAGSGSPGGHGEPRGGPVAMLGAWPGGRRGRQQPGAAGITRPRGASPGAAGARRAAGCGCCRTAGAFSKVPLVWDLCCGGSGAPVGAQKVLPPCLASCLGDGVPLHTSPGPYPRFRAVSGAEMCRGTCARPGCVLTRFLPAGHMEGGRRLEPGQAPRPPASPERPEPPRGPHAVLESKVKALKEKRGAGRPGAPTTTTSAPPERPSPKKPRPRRGKPGMDAAVAEPRAQLRTYLTDGLLDAGEPPEPPHGTQGTRRVPGGSQQHPKEGSRGGAPPAADGGGAVAGWEPLSLAERVERNRRLLQEVLGLAAAGSAHEVLASDGDWDSGVSLQDAEGCRAFVPGQELELSPRHEQAKQLLQRARMKARTNPLRASHDLLLLPAAPRPSREPGGTPRPSFAPQEGEGPAGGSLSDSSSGESSCGPRRPRGPSPSRVRFEDESARDAEVRYLERLRHRRPLGSALERAGSEARGQPGDGAGPAKARGGDVPTGGKCRACGSLLGAAEPAESSPVARGRERGGQGAAQAEPKSRPLGPGGSPLWILPSRQRIHTEKIKETYIGDVRRADEADSALESTDTSDSCRTDSEEVGPRSPHPRAHRDPRARGHRAPRAPAQKEARAGKGASVASSPRAGAVGSGALCPPLSGSRDGGDPNEAPGSSEPPAPSSQPAGVPVSLRPPSPAPPAPKKPAPRCLAGKTSPAAAGARSPMLGALPPNPRARGSGGVPAAPSGSRGAPSVPCTPTTATTPAGRTARGQEEGHCHSLGLSPLGMLPGHPGRSRTGARRLGSRRGR
uniref:DUF4685 domain-containing protein n=1 Tax=Anser cygnoides TaxID=8845 RepID=A0A8B9ETB3_ANSCY